MVICFFGDSFVAGVGDDEGLGWTGRVCLAARRAGHDVTGYALGVRRDTSATVRERWAGEAEARLAGDLDGRLVFSFGTNDCCPDEDRMFRVPREQALANAATILTRARALRPTLMVGPPPVGDDPDTDRAIKALSQDFHVLCERLGVPYLPVFDTLRAHPVWTAEAAANDGSHPGSGGYGALAELVGAWPAWQAWFAGRPGDARR